jgi:hypothetical protein
MSRTRTGTRIGGDGRVVLFEQPDRHHKGECPECFAFRMDGGPPSVHRWRCTRGPSGDQLDVRRLTPLEQTRLRDMGGRRPT